LAAHFVRGPSASWRARIGVQLAELGASALTKVLISRVSPGADVLLFARQSVPDEMVRVALQENADTQIVILGAGLDTSGLRIGAERRRRGELAGSFFEVDVPAMLAEKQRVVARLAPVMGKAFADHIRYVPCTFGESELGAALLAAGFDSERPAIWIWSGVIHYLTDAAVRLTIAELRRLSCPGSRLFFDYVVLEAYEKPDEYGFSQIKARFDSFGEVMSFGLRQGGDHAREWLASQGLQLIRCYAHQDMVAVYETITSETAPSRGAPWANLCVASF
jgi:methyltransferase (TIGR00027 family)